MSDTLMTIIGIFIAVILMILFPLVETAGKNDDIAQTAVQMAASNFVNEVAKEGKITQRMYDELLVKIQATGNMFDVIIEARILDENPEKRTVTSGLNVTESQYYSIYTNTIMDSLKDHGEYLLKKDDYILVTIKNTNTTLGTQLKGVFYKFLGKDTYTIGASASALTINTGVPDRQELAVNFTPGVDSTKDYSWWIGLRKIQASSANIESFNLIYILDYSGSMVNDITKMHNAIANHLQQLKEIADENTSLRFNVSIVGFGTYAAEIFRESIDYNTNMDTLTSRLNEIKSRFSAQGGLMIPSNRYVAKKDWLTGVDMSSAPLRHSFGTSTSIQTIGPGTSYGAGVLIGGQVAQFWKGKNSFSTYVIFMTDGVNRDTKEGGRTYNGFNYIDNLAIYEPDTYKTFFDTYLIGRNRVKKIYVISYKYTGPFEWLHRNGADVLNADEDTLARIFENIMTKITTTVTGVGMSDTVELQNIDTSKNIIIEFSGSSALPSELTFGIDEISSYPFIEYRNTDGKYYLDSVKLRDYCKDILELQPEEEFNIHITITYYSN